MKATRHYHGPLVQNPKHTEWKPIKKDTAAELLQRADDRELKLTAEQRATLKAKAGDKYKPGNALERRKGESVQDYLARIKKHFSK